MVLGESDDLAVEGRNPARIWAFPEDLVDLRAVVRLVADEEQRGREQVGDAVVVDADQLEAYVLEVRQRERPESEILLIGVDRGEVAVRISTRRKGVPRWSDAGSAS